MFQPYQAVLLAWTSPSLLGCVQHAPASNPLRQSVLGTNASEHEHIRGLVLTTGLAFLLLGLALMLLLTSPAASTHAAVAVPPVFGGAAPDKIASR